MVSRKTTRVAAMVAASMSLALSFNALLPTAAPAFELIQEAIEGVVNSDDEENQDDWYIPGRRQYRCELIAESPVREGDEIKSCAYGCLGYGAGATFPWPASLPCPVGYNELMPPFPEGYPSPYPSGDPSILAD